MDTPSSTPPGEDPLDAGKPSVPTPSQPSDKPAKPNASRARESVLLKMLACFFLGLILLIPSYLISGLVDERERLHDQAASEISTKWGGAQSIGGPVLTIPYYQTDRDSTGKALGEVKHYAHFFPDTMILEGILKPETRYRGIYKAVVYTADMKIDGSFPAPDFKTLNIPANKVEWKQAVLNLGVTDVHGIVNVSPMQWNGQAINLHPGVTGQDVFRSGLSTPVTIDSTSKNISYQLSISLNGRGTSGGGNLSAEPPDENIPGTGGFSVLPLARQTTVKLRSAWPSPKFTGAFIPTQRQVTDDGFTATWTVSEFNRNFAQQTIRPPAEEINTSGFGVSLMEPVDFYQKSTRAVKYVALFIGLTFLTFFLFEVLNNFQFHPIQYLLVGFALVLFYLLLISLSEYMVFGWAYLLASAGIVLMISVYTASATRNRLVAGITCAVLALLYGYLYVLLQLEEMSLVVGSMGLFIILAVVMFITRKVNWYNIGSRLTTTGASKV